MKPVLPKGTRDFLPGEVRKRDFIFQTIKEVFVKYGYAPIETPAMEDLRTLTGKYGDEGDQLLFKVLNNGDFLSKADKQALSDMNSQGLVSSISKRGLRYDLTIPFARFVVMHQNDLSFPFKRYQIQPVWRGDRPQKGRYQEFYQCDVDVVGSDSLMYEAELLQIYDEVFSKLGVEVVIKMNNRKILYGMAEVAGAKEQFMGMTIAIDKLDKIGMEGVTREMEKSGLTASAIEKIKELLTITDLQELKSALSASETGLQGVDELLEVHEYLDAYDVKNTLVFDITLARGLNYYTGFIVEVAASETAYPDLVMGSIGGGGRYADLTGVFGMKNMSGVGVSFGAARIYDVMQEIGAFPQGLESDLKVLLTSFDKKSHLYAYRLLLQLREAGIAADIYPEPTKMGKQMKYADDRNAPYVIIVGDQEMETGLMALKHMKSGEQNQYPVEELITKLQE